MGKAERSSEVTIKLYDHLPLVVSWLPLVSFLVSGALLLPQQLGASWRILEAETLFWVNFAVMWYWILAFFANFDLKKFLFLMAAIGTLVGIPVIVDLLKGGNVIGFVFNWLGVTLPAINASAYFILGIGFFLPLVVWDFVWSRMQTRVIVTPGELRLKRWGQREDTFELIGLKTSHEPLDYLEKFLGAYGTFGISLRTGKHIFEMKRIFGLYRVWWFPFLPGKKSRIEALIAGTNVNASHREKVDVIDAMDSAQDDHEDHDGIAEDHRDGPDGRSSDFDGAASTERRAPEVR